MPFIHAFKVTKRTRRVKYLSLVFTDGARSEDFKMRLRSALAREVKTNGRFEIRTKYDNAPDWFIIFQSSWPEAGLDKHLKRIATELGAEIYIEPGIPLAELNTDISNFVFNVNPLQRRADN